MSLGFHDGIMQRFSSQRGHCSFRADPKVGILFVKSTRYAAKAMRYYGSRSISENKPRALWHLLWLLRLLFLGENALQSSSRLGRELKASTTCPAPESKVTYVPEYSKRSFGFGRSVRTPPFAGAEFHFFLLLFGPYMYVYRY